MPIALSTWSSCCVSLTLIGVTFSLQRGSPSQVESDEEDLAADKQMLALYDADPVKTEQQFGVDAAFIQELREHVAEVEMRRASHSHGHGGETSAVLQQNIRQMQPRRAIDSATLSASDESDIDVTVNSFVNQESEDKEDDAEVIVCCL